MLKNILFILYILLNSVFCVSPIGLEVSKSKGRIICAGAFVIQLNKLLRAKESFESMLEYVNLDLSLSKQEYQTRLRPLQQRLYELEHAVNDARVPVMIVFEGWSASGKGRRRPVARPSQSRNTCPPAACTSRLKLVRP